LKKKIKINKIYYFKNKNSYKKYNKNGTVSEEVTIAKVLQSLIKYAKVTSTN
jgi:hypothetical protein